MRFYLLIMQSLLFLKLFLSQHSFKASHKSQTFKIVKRVHIPRKNSKGVQIHFFETESVSCRKDRLIQNLFLSPSEKRLTESS